MSAVDVDLARLSQLAAHCHQSAGGLPAANPPPGPTPAFQPTAAAVAAIHADVELLATRFAERLEGTAQLLSATVADFRRTDDDNADRISAVGPG